MRKFSKTSLVIPLAVLALTGGAIKFYHYNYVANTLGQARTLRLPGFDEYFCKNIPYQSGKIDHCGGRAMYADGDWGITAYFTLYGVPSRDEAEEIAKFMVDARKRNGQEHIPMNVQIYSVPRSAGGYGPVSAKYKIFDEDL